MLYLHGPEFLPWAITTDAFSGKFTRARLRLTVYRGMFIATSFRVGYPAYTLVFTAVSG